MNRFDVRIGCRVRKGGAAVPNLAAIELSVNDGEDGKEGELMHEGAYLPKGHATAYDESCRFRLGRRSELRNQLRRGATS
jgi:hypothetical protein